MSNPTELANLFQQTITGTTESIKNAQKTLQALQKDPNFLSNLLLIIKQVNLPISVRKAASIYTKKYAKNQISQKDQPKLNNLAQALLNQLSNSSTDLALRRHIGTTLQVILLNDQKCIIRNSFNTVCIKMLQASDADDPNVNYQFLGFFVQILMSSFAHLTKQSNTFIQNTLSSFSKLNLKIFNFAIQVIQQSDKNKIINIFRMLKIYSFTMKTYIKKIMLAEIQTAKLLYDENLALLLTRSLQYNIKNNELSTSLIFYNTNADQQIIQIFHSIKADYVQSVSLTMRIVMLHFKDKQMLSAHIILNSPSLIPSVINALNQIFINTSYYKIKSYGLVKLIQELISLLIIAVKNMFYFKYFVEYKKIIFEGIILKILGFSPSDCEILSDDPDQFINQLLQIIEMQSNRSVKAEAIFSQKNDQVEQYSNLRTLAAVFLDLFCKHIDGVLPQIIIYSLSVLKGQIQSQFSKPLLLLLLCILRDHILERQNEGNQIVSTICQILRSKKFPDKILDTQKTHLGIYEANIQYLLALLTLYRYYSKISQIIEQQLMLIGEIIYNLLNNDRVSQVLQYCAFDLVIILCDRQNQFEPKFIKVLINLILQNKNQIKCLQCLANIITTTNQYLQPYGELIMQTVHNLVKIVISQAEKKTLINQLLVNKCCSVITHVCQNPSFIPKLIPQIQQTMMPLLVYIDGKNSFDFQEDILMMMSSFIEKSKVVTQNQLIMFQIIPRLFYSQYQFLFGHAFQTLHVFIFYGSSILSSAPQAVKAIIDMAVTNMNTIQVKNSKRNEAQNTDGVLILQSLILSCGSSFSNQLWIQIAKAITKRLQNPPVKSHILHSNILATLALILAGGSKAFTNQDCDVLLNRVLQNYYCFVVQYSIKVAIIAFSQLLGRYTQPFICNRFTNLLDTTLTLIQSFSKKQIFDKNPMTDMERDYQVSVLTIKNAIVNMNELQNFKDKIKAIKQQNPTFLQQAISQLSDNKSTFLKQIFNVTIIKNQGRKILKIKK